MKPPVVFLLLGFFSAITLSVCGAPVIDPIPAASIPAGKTLIMPVTASSPNGRPLTFSAASSTNRITVVIHTNNPFWKMSVAQAAAANAPGAFSTPFRGGVVTVTNVGDMTLMLFRDVAPHSVDVIQGLTAAAFYTSNTIFHRVVPGFVIQGGDPNTNGSGGPIFHYDDEFNPNAIFSGNGQLALANAAKDADGSQFFITAGPQRALDFRYTLFGQLVRGFDVLTNILNTPTNGASRPLADEIITRAAFVPDNFDTVLTLAGTNLAGVTGTISVIADDGAGGRATNFFTATTVADTSSSGQPLLFGNPVLNLVAPINTTLTNVFNAVGLDGQQLYWFPEFADQPSYNAASNSTYNLTNSVWQTQVYNVTNAQGQIQFFLRPATNYVGPVNLIFFVSNNSQWSLYQQFGLSLPPYDQQAYTFAFGDTAIAVQATNVVATALTPFTNQLLAIFTNGILNSAATNFTAAINWGDNLTNSGTITTNLNWKEVRGAHTYTNAGDYPVYITIQSGLGASATVVSTASVPPLVTLTRSGTNNTLRWPSWATAYQVQTNASLPSTSWTTWTNLPALNGYDNVITNATTNKNFYFRLKK